MTPHAHTLVAAYAVGALEETEVLAVQEHLAGCETCREDYEAHVQTVVHLATAAAETPPVRLRAAVLAQLSSTPQERPAVTAPPAPEHAVAPRPQVTFSRALFALAATVLGVLVVGAGAFGLLTSQQLSDVRAQQAVVQSVLAADDVSTFSGTPELAGGVESDEIVILSSQQADAALLLPAGLPVAPEGSTWQAWTLADGEAVSAGVFDVSGGEAVALDSGVRGVQSVAVSLEPAGGSSSPTTDPVVVVPLA